MANEERRSGNGEGFTDEVRAVLATDEANPVVTPDGNLLLPYRVVGGNPEAKIEYLKNLILHGIDVYPEAPPGSVYLDKTSTSRSFGMPRNWSGSNWNPKGPTLPWGTTSSSNDNETIH